MWTPTAHCNLLAVASIFSNSCLPDTSGRTYIIFPYWDDGYTINSGFGIFTSISGTAPNRIFNIEWRNQYFPGSGTANYEVRLYEGQARFDVIYGQLDNGNTSATAGVQKDTTHFTQYFCNGSGGAATGGQSYIQGVCRIADSDGDGHSIAYTDVYAYTYTNSNVNTNSDCYIHAYANSDSDSDRNGNSYSHAHSYANGHSHSYSNSYAYLRPRRVAIGPAPASGPLCHPGRPRHGQHALHRRRPDRRRHADRVRPGLAL